MPLERFTLVVKSRQVEIETLFGVVTVFTLRELDGKGRDAHLTRLAKAAKIDVNGKPQIGEIAGIQAGLLASCLLDHEGKPVSEQTVNSWPARVLERLCAIAEELNAFTPPEQVALGNVSKPTSSDAAGSSSPIG